MTKDGFERILQDLSEPLKNLFQLKNISDKIIMVQTSYLCTVCGLTSLLGILFFIICGIIVFNNNKVFLQYKTGLNSFTITSAQLSWKFW